MEEKIGKTSVSRPGDLSEGEIDATVKAILEDTDVHDLLAKIGITKGEAYQDLSNKKFILPKKGEDEVGYAKRYIKFQVVAILMNKYNEKIHDDTSEEARRQAEKLAGQHSTNLKRGDVAAIIAMIESQGYLLSRDGKTAKKLTPKQKDIIVRKLREGVNSIDELLDEMEFEDEEPEQEFEENLEAMSGEELDENSTAIPELDDSEIEDNTVELEESEEDIDLEEDNSQDLEEVDQTEMDEPESDIVISKANLPKNYEPYVVNNTEYMDMHPEHKDATFVKATPGTDVKVFAKTLLLLQKDSETRVVGVFNGITLDATEYTSVAELESAYAGEQQLRREKGDTREKGEFIEEGQYYQQFFEYSDNKIESINQYNEQSYLPSLSKDPRELLEHTVIKMSDKCPDAEMFLEAAMHKVKNTIGKTYIEINGLVLCASEFENKEELSQKIDEINKVQAYNKEIEEHPEKHPGKEKKDIFIHSKSYYKSLVVVDKKSTDTQIKETGNPSAKVLKPASGANYKQLSEAGRYFGARNPNIYIKGRDDTLLKPAEFSSIKELDAARFEAAKANVDKILENQRTDLTQEKIYMDLADLSEEQRQRWQLQPAATVQEAYEHPEDGILQYLNLKFGSSATKETIIADLVDFKRKGFDVGFSFWGGFVDTRMCESPEEIKALMEKTIEQGQQKTANQFRVEREVEVFENLTNGVDIAEIDAVLMAGIEETLENSNNGAEVEQIVQAMANDGIKLLELTEKSKGKVPESIPAAEVVEEDEHPFPTMPEER